MHLPLVQDAEIPSGTRVLLRADFDVVVRDGRIADTVRIEASLPTIRFLLQKNARIRLIAHRGRPGGMRQRDFSLAPVGDWLSRALERPVRFIADPFAGAAADPDADVALFENLRFWPGEEHNDPAFAALLAAQGEIYVNEAFANCHRPHASMVSLPARMPGFAGMHLAEEIAALEKILLRPERPFVAILGGAKTETKVPLIERLLRDADWVLVGGALANAFFASRGKSIGKSAADAGRLVSAAALESEKLVLPSDVIAADRLAPGAPSRICAVADVRAGEYIADVGPESVARFISILADARTVVWNGPLGYAEAPDFAKSTTAAARAIRDLHAFTVVGGGDTLAALKRYGISGGFSHVSTGGGAMLAFLSGEKLPGLEALRQPHPQL